MIKKFIDRLEGLSTEGWIAILNYIDDNIDKLNERSKKNETKVNELREDFEILKGDVGDVKAIIDSNTELSKTIKNSFDNIRRNRRWLHRFEIRIREVR